MIYTASIYDDHGRFVEPSNEVELAEVVGSDRYECPECDGGGEREGEYGPAACYPCVAGWPVIVDHQGKIVMLQHGDFIERRADGLHYLEGSAKYQCQDCDFAAIGPRSKAEDLMHNHTISTFHRRRRKTT